MLCILYVNAMGWLLGVIAVGLLAFVLSLPHPVVGSGVHVATTSAASSASQR